MLCSCTPLSLRKPPSGINWMQMNTNWSTQFSNVCPANRVLTEPWQKLSLIHKYASNMHSRTSNIWVIRLENLPALWLFCFWILMNRNVIMRSNTENSASYTSGVSMVTVLAELSIRKPPAHTNTHTQTRASWSTEGAKQKIEGGSDPWPQWYTLVSYPPLAVQTQKKRGIEMFPIVTIVEVHLHSSHC